MDLLRCVRPGARWLISILLLLSAPLPSATSSETTPKGVITLDAKNFDASIRDGNVWLVEFYAPWCGHCVRFAPTYDLVAQKLHGMHGASIDGEKKRNIMVGKVDGAAERAITSRFSVEGFPSFYLIDGWTTWKYEGTRSLEALVHFALKSHEDEEPIPFLNSPFGPMGQLRALLMFAGTKIIGVYEFLEGKGFSPLMASFIMCSVGIVVGLFSIIMIGIMTLPKPKED